MTLSAFLKLPYLSRNSPTLLEDHPDALPFDRIRCPDLLWIAEQWLALPRSDGQHLPRWGEFRIRDFVKTASKLCVLHVEDKQPDRTEFTVYGEHPTCYVGLGKPLRLAQMKNDPRTYANYVDIRDRANRAASHEKPQYARKTLSWNGRDDIEYEAMMLPFAPDASSVQRILQPVSARIRGGHVFTVQKTGSF